MEIVGKALAENSNTIISDYIQALHRLTQEFNNSELRDIQVVVHCLVSQVEDIGKHTHCGILYC